MNKILLTIVIATLLIGTTIAVSINITGNKIRSITEIPCNNKYDTNQLPNSNCEGMVQIPEDNPLKIDLINDSRTGKEVMHIYGIAYSEPDVKPPKGDEK